MGIPCLDRESGEILILPQVKYSYGMLFKKDDEYRFMRRGYVFRLVRQPENRTRLYYDVEEQHVVLVDGKVRLLDKVELYANNV